MQASFQPLLHLLVSHCSTYVSILCGAAQTSTHAHKSPRDKAFQARILMSHLWSHESGQSIRQQWCWNVPEVHATTHHVPWISNQKHNPGRKKCYSKPRAIWSCGSIPPASLELCGHSALQIDQGQVAKSHPVGTVVLTFVHVLCGAALMTANVINCIQHLTCPIPFRIICSSNKVHEICQ